MTQPLVWGSDYLNLINTLVDTIEALRTKEDMIAQNSSLLGDKTVAGSYLNATGARTDLVAFDMSAASGAINGLISYFDTGSPPPKAYLFKML